MTNRRIQVHLGTAEDMGRRFVDAWQRAASGESVREEHLTFVDFKQMLGTLSDERLRLLKEVRREEATSVRELAERLHRDYKNVYDDVERLTAAGLLERDEGRLTAPYETILAEMSLAPT
jgi:predicted transcriptional regulator